MRIIRDDIVDRLQGWIPLLNLRCRKRIGVWALAGGDVRQTRGDRSTDLKQSFGGGLGSNGRLSCSPVFREASYVFPLIY